MAAGLPDRVDCERLAGEAAVLRRVYELSELPRLQDLLADERGAVHASIAFERIGAGKAGANVHVEAEPYLVCQRCLQGFPFAIAGKSDVEFVEAAPGGAPAENGNAAAAQTQREMFLMDRGRVSLRDMVEEELLLAIPAIAACSAPETCSNSRSLAALREILKKT